MKVGAAAATWTVPPTRMKTKLDHRVPLSSRAVAVLDDAREYSDRNGLVFPSPTGRVLSYSTLSKLLRELGIGAVPDGFRSSFRDWAAERSDVPREVCELALAHVSSDRMEAPTGAATCSNDDADSCRISPTTFPPVPRVRIAFDVWRRAKLHHVYSCHLHRTRGRP